MSNLEKPYIDFNNVFKEKCEVGIVDSSLHVLIGDTQGVLSPIGITTNNCIVFEITSNLINKIYSNFLMILHTPYLIIGLGEYYTTKPLPLVFSNKIIYFSYNILLQFSSKHMIKELIEFRTVKYR